MRLSTRDPGYLALVGALLILSSAPARCQSGPPASQRQVPQLEFSLVDSTRAGSETQPALSIKSPGTVELGGVISTPNPCYEVNAALSAEGQTLTLTLTASARPGMCAQVLGSFPYRATISPLSSGSHEIVVRHTYPGTGWEERIYRLQASVP